MTVTEANGDRNTSDITEYANLLFLTGSPNQPVFESSDVAFIELKLTGEWEWGSGVSNDDALVRIGNAIHSAVLEAIADTGSSTDPNSANANAQPLSNTSKDAPQL